MNFTREPIIETIVSPKEGNKLLVRSSKGAGHEEYYVDALEVVSFGHSFFFRSLERPRPFLVPVSDYEIVEVKEVRAPLKTPAVERSIKIGGGREASIRREHEKSEEKEEEVTTTTTTVEEVVSSDQRGERRRDRRRNRRRRGAHHHEERAGSEETKSEASAPSAEPSSGEEKVQASHPPAFSTLLPPPPTLISETIGRYKEKFGVSSPTESEPTPPKEKKPEEPEQTGEGKELYRMTSHDTAFAFNYSYPSQEDIFFP